MCSAGERDTARLDAPRPSRFGVGSDSCLLPIVRSLPQPTIIVRATSRPRRDSRDVARPIVPSRPRRRALQPVTGILAKDPARKADVLGDRSQGETYVRINGKREQQEGSNRTELPVTTPGVYRVCWIDLRRPRVPPLAGSNRETG